MKPEIVDGIVINPTVEVKPWITISPFSLLSQPDPTESSRRDAVDYLQSRFEKYSVALKARYAIEDILNSLSLGRNDIVTILTSTGNGYVSGCVTEAIEHVCGWSRKIESETKLLFVIHDFGYPFKDVYGLRKYGLPIVEDCTHCFIDDKTIGVDGDYSIYSLAKNLPLQVGAVVGINNGHSVDCRISEEEADFILRTFGACINDFNDITLKRKQNIDYLCAALKDVGIKSFFNTESFTPNVFMFTSENAIDYPLMKKFLWENGVECSVFYGRDAFFIPCNHLISKKELDYMIALIKYFKKSIRYGI